MKNVTETYVPINCNYYDKLEAWAVLRKNVSIKRYFPDGSDGIVEGRIVDFFIREGAEYLKMADGHEIRLDYLISVNGEELPNAC
ncbi:MAG: hypothetical protein MRZ79_10320 [Bacteroidia bacterium]|nr:hypothetical protein [Bacteroidia bacterium]